MKAKSIKLLSPGFLNAEYKDVIIIDSEPMIVKFQISENRTITFSGNYLIEW